MSFLIPYVLMASIQCSVYSTDGVREYSRFYNLSYKDTGVNEQGFKTAESRKLTKTESAEAWACLNASANKKYCGAVALLAGCYADGWQQDPLHCLKDQAKFHKYQRLRDEVCPT